MSEEAKRKLSKAVPNYLSWILLISISTVFLILLLLNTIKLKQLNDQRFLFFISKYNITKAWCKLTHGQFIDNTKSYLWHNPDYTFKCIPSYADQNSPCESSNQCQGTCLANVPIIESYTDLSQIKFDGCTRQKDSGNLYESILNFSCPNIKLEGKCSKFESQRNPELNGQTIMFHIFAQAMNI